MAADTARLRRIIGTEFGTELSAARSRHGASSTRLIDLWRRPDTLLSGPGVSLIHSEKGTEAASAPLSAGAASQNAAKPGRQHAPFRQIGRSFGQKIIGRGRRCLCRRLACSPCVVLGWQFFRALHQIMRQHGVGALLQISIHEPADLFAHVGGVAQSRKFIALQGVAGSRQQRVPRGWVEL